MDRTSVTSAPKRVADVLTPYCTGIAGRWDAEAQRRQSLRTPEHLATLMEAQRSHRAARTKASMARAERKLAKAMTRWPLASSRRAARTSHRAARRQARSTRSALRAAHHDYPPTLWAVAGKVHAGHGCVAAVAAYGCGGPQGWALWPIALSAAVLVAHPIVLWLGRRGVTTPDDLPDNLTGEERRLMKRLDPAWWTANAEQRGLAGTLPSKARLTPSGLVSHVRLDGLWTPASLRAKTAEIRALLGARSDLRIEVTAGSHGDRATITLRTRSAADGIDLNGWEPGAPWGIDTITGEPVAVPIGRRMLIAGMSGAGKSWAMRPLMAEASEHPDHRLVVLDLKKVEARCWQHRARTATTVEEIAAVTAELVAEMQERLDLIPRGADVVKISTRCPRITIVVDEGSELLAASRGDAAVILDDLRSVARMGRAAEIILIWATQKPTISGANAGLDPQISAQISVRAALALSTAGESRVVLGEDATDRGWHAHELPIPGVALIRSGPESKPNPVRTRAIPPHDVIALPDRPIWASAAVLAVQSPVSSGEPLAAVPTSNRARVLDAVRNGSRSVTAIANSTGLNKGTVSSHVAKLVETGDLIRDETGIMTAEMAASAVIS